MKPNPDRIGEGLDANAEVPDARAEKIAEVQAVLRGSVGKVLKGKARERIDVLMQETNWVIKVAACETPQDFLRLFEFYGIPDSVWRKPGSLQNENHYTLYNKILNRFRDQGGWDGFLTFMGVKNTGIIDASILNLSAREQVAACKTPQDFLTLFALHEIPESVWRNSGKIADLGHKALYNKMLDRFRDQGCWNGFLTFMGVKNTGIIDASILYLNAKEQVAVCKTPQDFLTLFALHEIPESVWRNSAKIADLGHKGLYNQIFNRFRDKGGWQAFLDFMPTPTKQVIDASILNLSASRQVAACKTPQDFLTLFVLHEIPESVWRNSKNLRDENHGALYKQISNRFRDKGGWQAFLDFMPTPTKQVIDASILNLSAREQVAACKTPQDFLTLFALHEIPESVWRNSQEMRSAGYWALKRQTTVRFRDQGGWDGFLTFMGVKNTGIIDASILNLSAREQVAACKTPQDFLTLFALHEIPESVWRNSGRLQDENHKALYHQISNRFRDKGGWEGFLAFMDGKDEATLDAKIESLNLEDAIALLAHNPSKLKVFLATSCSELTPEEIDRLVGHSFKRLHARRVYDYSNFEEKLAAPHSIKNPKHTTEAAVCIAGNAPGADSVLVENNVSTRRIKVATDGTFTGRISLEIGEKNNLRITPINHEKKQIGPIAEVAIYQTGEPDDIGALVALLNQMGVEALESIKSDPGRHEYVVRQTEQVLIRKFSGTFAKGKDYVEKLIAESKSSSVRKILKAVLKRFTAIDKKQHPNIKKGHPLYFFQKYCVAEIQRAMEEGRYGICLANDPGLGKTRTALVAINGDPATIITPNSVVTSWAEEAQRALIDNDLLVLREMHSKDRKELLRTSSARHCVTNVDFLRSTEGDERYNLLSNEATIVVQDEAHGLLNLSSKQSIGARRLKSKFLLLLTATPAKDSHTLRRILHLLDPSEARFKSDKAFAKAFPGDDPNALRTLHIIKQQYMIRFTKEDALETMDPALPLSKQKHCLPRKEYVPQTQMGGYTLTEDQCQATYELFLNFSQWTQKYDRHVPKDAIAREDQLRGNSNALVKSHALRQTANNPSYIGSKKPDPKGKEMMKTVDAMLAEGRKVVIFCQYISQAQKYAELLKVHCPSVYTGLTSKQGDRTGLDGKSLLYKKNSQGAWVMDNRGLPQEDPQGEPMSTLDYERLAFQNAPERRVMIATYAAGSVGVTFTAGKATIFDDLPEDVIREIQAEDRTHRIDHEHQTHHSVKYVKMLAHYPKSFLERMKKTWVRKNTDGTYFETDDPSVSFTEAPIDADYTNEIDTAYNFFFAQGTYDEVRLAGLKTQRTRFRLINDGIAGESELPEIKNLVA